MIIISVSSIDSIICSICISTVIILIIIIIIMNSVLCYLCVSGFLRSLRNNLHRWLVDAIQVEVDLIPVSVKKHSSGEEETWKY